MQGSTITSRQNFIFPVNILNGKSATIVCMLLAAACKIILTTAYFSFSHDLLLQSLAAKSMADGHGFTIPQVHAADLSKVVYEPMVGWPPAYSACIIPFYFLLGKNIELASLVTTWVFAVLFIPLVFKLLRQLAFPIWLINISILIYGLSMPQYLVVNATTDQPALMCYILAISLLLTFLKVENSNSTRGIAIGVCSALGVWFRFMYLPASFLLPCFLIWNSYTKKDARIKHAGFYALLANLIVVGVLLIFQYVYTGSATYYRPAQKGFFPSNLQSISPFVLTTFMKPQFYIMKLSLWLHLSYAQSRLIITITGLIAALFMTFVFCRYALKTKMNIGTPVQTFFLAGGLLSTCCIALLFYLSLTLSSYYSFPSNFNWVYGSEERYFIIPVFCLQVFFMWWLFMRQPVKHSILLKLLRVVFVIVITIEWFHGIAVIGNYAAGRDMQHAEAFPEKEIKTFLKNVSTIASQQQKDIIIGSQTPSVSALAVVTTGKALFNLDEINTSPLYCAQPTLFVLVIRERHMPYFKKYIENNKLQRQGLVGKEYNIFYHYLAAGVH
ncbi:MAG: hypothetical protein QM731_20320 [Chitinophagaceae bacterium]